MKAQKLNHMLAEKGVFSFELIVRKFKRLYSYKLYKAISLYKLYKQRRTSCERVKVKQLRMLGSSYTHRY